MPIKNDKQTGVSPPTLGMPRTIPAGVIIFRISYVDANNNAVDQFLPNSVNFSTKVLVGTNRISMKIHGRFNSVSIKTGNTVIDQLHYASAILNTFCFNITLNHSTDYVIQLD